MKKALLLLALLTSAIMAKSAPETYATLWKQYDTAVSKGQPRTALGILDKITAKATHEQAYGHLIKAQMSRCTQIVEISPDSAGQMAEQFKQAEARAKTPVVKAIYAAVIGSFYDLGGIPGSQEDTHALSLQWYKRALSNMDVLAKASARDYQPTLVQGSYSRIFGYDLLHVIAIQAKEYSRLYHYYLSHQQRQAACMAACLALRNEQSATDGRKLTRAERMQEADSLIHEYQDLDVAAELALDRYQLMKQDSKYSVAQRIAYIDQALDRWAAWPRANQLRNERTQLTYPEFGVSLDKYTLYPGQPAKVSFSPVRNTHKVTLRIYRLGKAYHDHNRSFYRLSDKSAAKLRRDIIGQPVQTIERQFSTQPEYQTFSDTATISPLPIGSYLIEARADADSIAPKYAVLPVTDVFVMAQAQPGKKDGQVRMVVVSATTGKPLPKATIYIRPQNDEKREQQLTTDANGEARYPSRGSIYLRATAGNDIYAPFDGIWASTYYYNNGERQFYELYTDRSLYRPGQTVQVAVMASARHSATQVEALTRQAVTLQLRDANYKVVAERQVTTDSYGTAACSFALPTSGLTGQYTIATSGESAGRATIRVEEYKRPTFQVEIDTVRSRYAPGDTITISGRATTYAGMPVQQAQVKTHVTRNIAMWWRGAWGTYDHQQLPNTQTDDEGRFQLRVPLTIDENGLEEALFYDFKVCARVTDATGETQEGVYALPLGTRPTALSCNLPDEIERDSTATISFAYTNSAGQPLTAQVSYTIDGQNHTAPANQPIDLRPILTRLKSGRHQMQAVCGTDTIKETFVLFSASDTHAPIDTPDWFYLSANQFTDKGSVRLQLGSSAPSQYVVYTLFADDQILESGAMTLKGKLHLRDFTYRSEYGDGLTLSYAWVKDGKCYSHTERIKRPMPNVKLKTRWTTFRDRLVPDQQETWTLHISRPDGQVGGVQLLATLYDRSLDAIYPHRWSYNNKYYTNMLSGATWYGNSCSALSLHNSKEPISLNVENFSLYKLTPWNLIFRHFMSSSRMRLSAVSSINPEAAMDYDEEDSGVGEVLMAKKSTVLNEVVTVAASDTEAKEDTGSAVAGLRDNFSETAFFYPQLETNEQGDVAISFQLPDAVTTWQFRALAHDRAMRYALINATAVAQKPVMVQPNMPRFIRMGDHATISVRVSNTTDQAQTGQVRMVITTADGQTEVYSHTLPFATAAKGTTSVSFDFTPTTDDPLLVCRVTATGESFSDGEQHYLPVLPDQEQVITTLPFTLQGAGKHTYDLSKLFGAKASHQRTTIQYTDQPAWLMVQALPSLANPSGDNAIELATAYYANSIAQHIVETSPAIGQALRLWQQNPSETLTSALERDSRLKSIVLEETPWLAEASSDTERLRSLAAYLDANQLQNSRSSLLSRLTKLQQPDGTFSWWSGMGANYYITVTVAETLVRLSQIAGKQPLTESMLNQALSAMDKEMDRYVAEIRKSEKTRHPITQISELACRYLYTSALAGRKATPTINYLLNLMERHDASYTIYGRANSAVILSLYGRTVKAKERLQSACEYTVYKEGMGRYYDTPLAQYSWTDYRIPTQTATIEALHRITPNDTATITQMQQWLLQEKRTTAWSTPINSVNAIYAFLLGNKAALAPSGEMPKFYDGSKQINMPTGTPMIGVTTYQRDGAMRSLTIDKQTSHTSWGAVYATALQPISQIGASKAGFSIERQIIIDGAKNKAQPKVGDRVKVRITIRADRDYDFVQVTDRRAACLEPAQQLSGYAGGYYTAPRDNSTSYFFDKMRKGVHVIETTYYIDRPGDYQAGSCTVQCAYSPSFTGRAGGASIHVNP